VVKLTTRLKETCKYIIETLQKLKGFKLKAGCSAYQCRLQ